MKKDKGLGSGTGLGRCPALTAAEYSRFEHAPGSFGTITSAVSPQAMDAQLHSQITLDLKF